MISFIDNFDTNMNDFFQIAFFFCIKYLNVLIIVKIKSNSTLGPVAEKKERGWHLSTMTIAAVTTDGGEGT